jgi:type IV secretion system protein VirB6
MPQLSAQALTYLLAAADNLMRTVAPVLLPPAESWGRTFAVMALLCACVKGAADWIGQRYTDVFADGIMLIGKIAFVALLLHYYHGTPIPGFGVSVSELFQMMGREIAGVIDISGLDDVFGLINQIQNGIEDPDFLDFFALILFYIILFSMIVLDGALLIVTSTGFIATALGMVFGPVCIVCLLFPVRRWQEKYWGWINFMWTYSMYRAVAAAYVFIASQFFLNFVGNGLHGDYTLGHLLPLSALMLASVFTIIYGALRVPHWTSELFGSVGHAGGGIEGFIRSAVATGIAFAGA